MPSDLVRNPGGSEVEEAFAHAAVSGEQRVVYDVIVRGSWQPPARKSMRS